MSRWTSVSLSPVERKLYESRMKLKSDIETISENQFNAGMQRGIVEGKLETAKNLMQFGLSIENIAKATGLTVQEIQAL